MSAAHDPAALARLAVEACSAVGASYADARVGRIQREELGLRNGSVGSADAPEEFGIGVRVVAGGAWGFAASALRWRERSPAADATLARELARRAVRVATELARTRRQPVALAGRVAQSGEYATPCDLDPFTVPLAEKVELLRAADVSLRGATETVVREASLSIRREEQWQATSDGALVHQVLTRCGAGISTTAAAHGVVQRRSFPSSFGGNFRAGGFESVLALDLASHGARMRDESVALCSAEPCAAGKRAAILMGNQVMLQIHESVGHPSELDRVFGHEVDLAGSSFADPRGLRSFRYGAPIVDLVADSTIAGGLDTRAFDDDAVASQRWHVVERGVLRGFHTSREWAGAVGEAESRGAARAESWFHPPIVRITNLSLAPGTWDLEALVADTEDGVLCDTVKTWSIDQRRLNFQFTTELGWEIKNGRRTRLVRDPTYQGNTPEFWRSCDAICGPTHWELWGIQNCGKGNPMQIAEMSHGAAPARFRDVTFVR